DLISRLPAKETEGALALELMAFQRSIKGNMRSLNLRTLFSEIPELLRVVAPCMLMSPITVSQYLPADPNLFDMVIFDEASQMPTCEAVPSLARAKSAVIVGDPKQMPPTSFFMGSGQDEENPETEDLESVLDDCLALGIPEKHLIWHYRSKHESLIAFSNIMYYSSRLCTYPSPDALDSKVQLKYIEDGVYERGLSKCNRQEAEALVAEVIRRLKDEKLRSSSLGIVTFSTPQQVYIERLLSKKIAQKGLESVAYEREEPLFVKNLENFQGDERDVILFSVCYGPDKAGKISLNFGPLNQLGGWRRLNVAVSRAREEMVVYSSMRYSMIDMSRTTSRGVAGLKAFLEFAEKGRTNISVKKDEIILNKQGIGKFIAEELSAYGYDCRCDVGVSDFKIDVAVVDPKNKHNFILAVLCDGSNSFSVKDRTVLQVQTLKRNNWNVVRLYAINFFNNPKREIKKIKDYLDKLTSDGKPSAVNFKKIYRFAKVDT
ncbi:MAG: DNA helicase, partial [Clostridia bacterium]|nr:DNA helicase [Clostridia bacterium]